MGFNQYKLEHHFPCLMGPKFHASEASGSKEDFNILLCISMVTQLGCPEEDPY